MGRFRRGMLPADVVAGEGHFRLLMLDALALILAGEGLVLAGRHRNLHIAVVPHSTHTHRLMAMWRRAEREWRKHKVGTGSSAQHQQQQQQQPAPPEDSRRGEKASL